MRGTWGNTPKTIRLRAGTRRLKNAKTGRGKKIFPLTKIPSFSPLLDPDCLCFNPSGHTSWPEIQTELAPGVCRSPECQRFGQKLNFPQLFVLSKAIKLLDFTEYSPIVPNLLVSYSND